jgi:hypothetical protein
MPEVFLCKVCGKQIPNYTVIHARFEKREPKYCSMACFGKRVKTYVYDHMILNEDNEFTAYFFGQFVTDGHLDREKATILGSVDKQIMDEFYTRTKHTGTMRISLPEEVQTRVIQQRLPFYSLKFHGDISKAIMAAGFIPGAKTGKEFIPTRCKPSSMFRHFLRGVIDGDGCIRRIKDKGYLVSSIVCSNKSFLEEILRLLREYEVVRGGTIVESPRTYINKAGQKVIGKTLYSVIFSHFDTVSICNYMYKDCTIKLNRKYEKFLSGKDFVLSQVIQKNTICSVSDCGEPSHAKGLCKAHHSQVWGLRRRTIHRAVYLKQRKLWYMKNDVRERARQKLYRQNNPETVKAGKQRYNATHREEINEYKRDYRNQNIETVRQQENASYYRNIENKKKQMKANYERNKPERLRKAAEYRQKKREEIRERDRQRYAKDPEKAKKKRMEAYYKKKAESENS